MSQKAKIARKWNQLLKTPAEVILKRKHDATQQLKEKMSTKSLTAEEQERQVSFQQKMARLQQLHEPISQHEAEWKREKSASVITQSAQTGANIHNNINVAINYTVHQNSQTIKGQEGGGSRRKKKYKRQKSQESLREKDPMNTSLTKLIDRQLLMSQKQSPNTEIPTKYHSKTKGDGITADVFHGDKIYLKNGNMCFKPLGMETVFESTEEAQGTLNGQKWKQQMKTMATQQNSKKRSFHTTESNIALQQQLNLATAQELVSFPFRLDLEVNEEQQYYEPVSTQASLPNQPKNGLLKSAHQFKQKNITSSKTAEWKFATSMTLQNLQKETESKSSLKTFNSVNQKNEQMAENRKVHSGLQQISSKFRTLTTVNSVIGMNGNDRANSIQAVRFERPPVTSVEFNESAIRRGSDGKTGGSIDSISINSGLFDALEPHPQKEGNIKVLMKDKIGPKLHRQQTGNSRIISRKLRDQPHTCEYSSQENLVGEEKEPMIQTYTELQNPPIMSHLTRLNKTLQAKSNQTITPKIRDEALIVQTPHDDNLSKLAIDYKLHLKNQEKIKSLMALIGGKHKSSQQTNFESGCNLDIDCESEKRNTQLPKIDTRRQETKDGEETGPPTQAASNFCRPSAKTSLKQKYSEPFNTSIEFPSQDNGSMERLLELSHEDRQFDYNRNTTKTCIKNDTVSHKSQQIVQFLDIKSEADYQRIMSPKVQQGNKILLEHHLRIQRLLKTGQTRANRQQPMYKQVRSKLFDKNITNDRIDAARGSDQGSEQNKGPSSYFRKQSMVDNDAIHVEEYQLGEFKSPRTNGFSNTSIKGIKLINQKSVDPNKDKHTKGLYFQTGLTFVMTNGKAQPSQKYINKNMTPYMEKRQFNSVKGRSSICKNALILKEASHQGKKSKQKQLKGARMKRGNNLLRSFNRLNTSQVSRQKGVIPEEKQELSHSDTSTLGGGQRETWQDIQEENAQLKNQILNQIAIFEQYLKVAILQHAVRQREANTEARKYGLTRFHSTDDHIFKRERDFQFDQHPSLADQMRANNFRRHTTISRKPNVTLVSKKGPKKQDSQMEIVEVDYDVRKQPSNKSQSDWKRKGSAKSRQSRSRSRKSSRSSSHQKNRHEVQSSFILQKQFPVEQLKSTSFMHGGQKRQASFAAMSRKISTHTCRSLERLKSGKGETTHEASHIAHQNWMNKIEKLWNKLNAQRNSELVKIQDEIRRNKERIQQLTRENLFELDVNYHDQKVLLKIRGKTFKVQNKLKNGIEKSKVQLLQKRVREELDRKLEFDTWGFHNHIIEYRLKVRMTEDIIDCAQRLAVKADSKTQRELNLLTTMRDRLYEDLRYFIKKREERIWRNWEGGFPFKPSLENRDMTLQQVQGRIEIHLQMIAFLEPRHAQLLRDIPPYNTINSQMIWFCTGVFGNAGWLQLFQLKLLRKQQEAQQHKKQYMPPVDYIKRMEVDPYTLKINTDSDDNQDENENLMQQQREAKSPSSWHMKKPDKTNQNNLKTGQEQIILAQKSPQYKEEKENGNKLVKELNPVQNKISSMFIERQDNQNARNPNEGTQILKQNAEKQIQRFEGDVVEHIKNQAAQQEKSDQTAQKAHNVANSSWLQVLEKEKQEKADREAIERKARAARLAILFEEEDVQSQDDEDLLDAGAAKQVVSNYIEKIETHLKVEKRILEAWQEKDLKEGDVPLITLEKVQLTSLVR